MRSVDTIPQMHTGNCTINVKNGVITAVGMSRKQSLASSMTQIAIVMRSLNMQKIAIKTASPMKQPMPMLYAVCLDVSTSPILSCTAGGTSTGTLTVPAFHRAVSPIHGSIITTAYTV